MHCLKLTDKAKGIHRQEIHTYVTWQRNVGFERIRRTCMVLRRLTLWRRWLWSWTYPGLWYLYCGNLPEECIVTPPHSYPAEESSTLFSNIGEILPVYLA